ncbi:MAG TPA: hypothetical protein VLS89_18075 [Candidatus Nanopelagicales bacterium]|nr:hypothetical protein [Candidatus Nanopelagicales bacterium]
MSKTLISLVAMMGLFATTGCMAPVEAEEISAEMAEAEDVGEAEGAITDGPLWKPVTLSCSIDWSILFQPRAKITNNTVYEISEPVKYTVSHYYGLPAFNGTTSSDLAPGGTVYVTLAHAAALEAMSCTASSKVALD